MGLGWDLKIGISDKFPGRVDAAGLAMTLWDALADLNNMREGNKNGNGTGPEG